MAKTMANALIHSAVLVVTLDSSVPWMALLVLAGMALYLVSLGGERRG